jgi:putative transposase
MDYSRPGKPTDNPFVESFNGSFRDECLNAHWFLSLEDAVMKTEAWRTEYNHYRPHSSLMDMTPVEFIDYCLKAEDDEQSLPGASSSDQMIFSTPGTRSSMEEKSSVPMKKK